MKIFQNYKLDEVLAAVEFGSQKEEMLYLNEKIQEYLENAKQAITDALQEGPKEQKEYMLWVEKNVAPELQYYAKQAYLGEPYDLLKKRGDNYKTVSDIGIEVEDSDLERLLRARQKEQDKDKDATQEALREEWTQLAQQMQAYHQPFFETHAHLFLDELQKDQDFMLNLMTKANVDHILVPSIESDTIQRMKELYDDASMFHISYAFGNHPKYLWKEKFWEEEKWVEFEKMLDSRKCAAIGETGLDYSYKEFCEEHKELQKQYFVRFIQLANRHHLPMVLHMRSGIGMVSTTQLQEDALELLEKNPIEYGAVLHCFTGHPEQLQAYWNKGIHYFGIGGAATYFNPDLEQSIRIMPEQAILLETDAPFQLPREGRYPNTPLTLGKVAEAIAAIRGCTSEHIIRVSTENALRLFYKSL